MGACATEEKGRGRGKLGARDSEGRRGTDEIEFELSNIFAIVMISIKVCLL